MIVKSIIVKYYKQYRQFFILIDLRMDGEISAIVFAKWIKMIHPPGLSTYGQGRGQAETQFLR